MTQAIITYGFIAGSSSVSVTADVADGATVVTVSPVLSNHPAETFPTCLKI